MDKPAIEATRGTIRELVDGTIRLTVEIDPINKKRFHELFPDINMRIAIIPLLEPHQIAKAEEDLETKSPAPKKEPKRQDLTRDAVMLCKEDSFQSFALEKLGGAVDYLWSNEDCAKRFIYSWCGIYSRAELNTSKDAAGLFKIMHKEYTEWAQDNG